MQSGRIRKAMLEALGFVAAFVLVQIIPFLVRGEFV